MQTRSTRWTARGGWTSPLPAFDGPSTLVLVFGDSDLLDAGAPAREALRQVVDAYPASVVVGCSTAGQALGGDLTDAALTVSATRFERSRPTLAVSPVDPASSEDVGRALGQRLQAAGDDLAAVLVLSEGLAVNGSALAAGLADGLHRDGAGAVPTIGGLAGDGDRFGRTWVLVDGEPTPSHVSAVGLHGTALEVGAGSCGGWTILGPQRVVTRSAGTVLHELDGRPALALYEEYLGERAHGLPGTALLFPLLVWARGEEDRAVVRTVLAVDERAQTMTFAGDVPEGSFAQLMRATTDRLVDAAGDAGALASLAPGGPALAVAVGCVGRRLLLGRRTEDELDAVLSALGPEDHLVGFYSYGELAPTGAGGCALHNQTMTLLTVRERGARSAR